MSGAGEKPADNTPRKDVDDEGDIDETNPRRDVGKVGHPQGVRTRRIELPTDVIERTRGGRIAECGADPFAPHHALQAHRPHQARHGAASDRDPFPEKLSPDLPDTIDSEVLLVHAPDFGPQGDIAPGSRRQLTRISAPGGVGVIRRRGDRQNAADRLDPVQDAVLVDEGDHGLNRRSSSAWAKYADALRRISLACRSSRFSRSSALMRSRSSVVGPGRRPWSRSARRTQWRSVSPEQPIFSAIEWIADHCEVCSASWSRTIRTARARTSGEYGGTRFVMAPSSQELEPPENPVRFRADKFAELIEREFGGFTPRPL